MGTMVFLAAAYILPLPLRFVGSEIPTAIPFRLTLFGIFAFMPGLVLGTILGLRTYRAQRRIATRTGTAIGAAMGWSSFFLVDFAGGWILPGWVPFFEVGGGLLFVLSALSALAAVLVLYALFSRTSYGIRRAVGVAGGVISFLAGMLVLAGDFDGAGLVCALISAGSCAVGGWVAGIGYARAGGNEMIPPGAVLREPEQSGR